MSDKDLREKIYNESFKVKRIFLELRNYSYFHSVLDKEGEDINHRFVGRREIVEKIRDFIQEATINTGAYLVSGFRGMGKTSVVNKALASLNPKSKLYRCFLLWLSLLPWVILIEKIEPSFLYEKPFLFSSIVILVFLLFSTFYLGHRSPIKDSFPNSVKNYQKLRIGFVSIFNGSFKKHKYAAHRLIGFTVIYVLVSFLVMVVFLTFEVDKNVRHSFFWFFTFLIVAVYLIIDLSLEFLNLFITYRKEKANKIKNFAIVLILVLVFALVICYWGYHFNYLSLNQCLYFIPVLLFLYASIKYGIKTKVNKYAAGKPDPILHRVLCYLNLQHYIVVKVNLGKDNLTEKDVLKYVTNEIYREYKKWYYNLKGVKRSINVFFLFWMLYGATTIFYFAFLGTGFKDFTNSYIQFSNFFPSQSLIQVELKEQELTNNIIKKVLYEDHTNRKPNDLNSYLEELIGLRNSVSIGYKQLIKKNDTTVLEKIALKPHYNFVTKDSIDLVENTNPTIEKTQIHNREITGLIKELNISDQTMVNKVKVAIALGCNEVDYLFLKFWFTVREVIIGDTEAAAGNEKWTAVINMFYPLVPNYSVFFLMFLFLGAIRFLPKRFLLVKTHYSSIKELNVLRRNIDASIVVEKGGGTSSFNTSFFSYLKKVSFQPLESKDITQRLIHILEDVSKTPIFFTKVRFIIIFDELDKISPHYNSSISNLEDEFDIESKEVRYQVRRKERIGRILSSMKHFLNSAQAKFIFIAGREMYDAALAGISDRESSLDSIFNDNKIYVNSFYKENEDNNLTDITSITEQYLCQFLIPKTYSRFQDGQPCLNMYNNYLKLRENETNESKEGKQYKNERLKIITTLKDFVVYLTYRSNGAPRKLSNLLEQYVVTVSDHGAKRGNRIVIGNNNENPFLQIGFSDQYKFSLISYLTTPIFLGLGNYLHEYSDKLLVSTSYMLDHLFKHHKFGLSLRSLSLTPEIVDINKEPQFREFLDRITNFFSKSHLRPIVSGVYDYKFQGKIEAEIKFLSRIDEQEAAALNFTLDESIELKRHFNRRLESLMKTESNVTVNNSKFIEDYVHNTSMLHMMIGDLHFYDEEYQEAILHYMDALQQLRQKDIKEMRLYEFVVYVRNKLKLGLAFEKNKMLDNALMTYSELSDLIFRKRNIPFRELGLARFVVKREKWASFNSEKIPNEINKYFKKNKGLKELIFFGRLKEVVVKEFSTDEFRQQTGWKMIHPLEDLETYYGVDPGRIIKNINAIDINYTKLNHFFKQSTGENIRVLYQPLIAKLHLIEKAGPNKLQGVDISRAIDEFDFLKLPLKNRTKRIIVSEFYNKIGDLLYFKNGTINLKIHQLLTQVFDDNEIQDPKESTSNIEITNSKQLLVAPIDAAVFYIKSLAILLIPSNRFYTLKNPDGGMEKIVVKDYYELSNDEDVKKFFKSVKNNLDGIINNLQKIVKDNSYRNRFTTVYLYSIANTTVDLIETLMSFIKNPDLQGEKVHEIIYSSLGISMTKLLELYDFSSNIFESIREYRLARSQKVKILHILKNCSDDTLNNSLKIPKKVDDFVQDCIELSYATHEQSYQVEKVKMDNILNNEQNIASIKSNTIETEINEVVTLYFMVYKSFLRTKISLIPTHFKRTNDNLKNSLEQFLKLSVNPYTTISHKNNRILSLTLLLASNKDELEYPNNDIDKKFIVLNSLGACYEIIKTYNLFGVNYVTTSNISLAKAHNQMAFWWAKFEDLSDQEGLKDILKNDVLSSKELNYMDITYHRKLSLEYNRRVLDFHSRGDTLNDFMKPVSYLDDFYNDNLIHFSIAIERNELLKGEVERRINELKVSTLEPYDFYNIYKLKQ